MATYTRNKEALRLSAPIIQKYHRHLKGIPIAHLFTTAKPSPRRKTHVWARASKVSDKFRPLTSERFIIVYTKAVWDQLDRKKKKALIDHELSHCGYDVDKDKAFMIDHDLEEFRAVLKRHGFWMPSIKNFVKAAPARKV